MLCSQSRLGITIENECVDADLLRYRVELQSIMVHDKINEVASNNMESHVMKLYYQTLQSTTPFGEDQLVQDCDQVLIKLCRLLCMPTQEYIELVPVHPRK